MVLGRRGEGICTDPQPPPMWFILPQAPHNSIFLCKVKAPHLSRLTMLAPFLRDFVTFIHGDNGHIQGPAHLSSHPPDPHSLPPSSQPVSLLLHVFSGYRSCAATVPVCSWLSQYTAFHGPPSSPLPLTMFLLLLSLVFLGLEEE